MGLDITAYTKLTPAPDAELKDGYPVDYEHFWHASEGVLKWTEENWAGHTAGIESGATYKIGDSFGFRAGSYSGYGQFRRWLAGAMGWPSIETLWGQDNVSGPFVELLHFADNEGVIGPVVAAKLAKDFADNEERIVAIAEQDGSEGAYYLQKYREWRKAFELASDGGAVEFR